MLQLILASSSPRRRQILQEFGYTFKVVSVQTSEIFKENLSLDQALLSISKTKAQATLNQIKENLESPTLVVGADTVVCLEGQILGKPADANQARKFLNLLSAKDHSVKTAVSLFHSPLNQWLGFVETSKVKMKNLNCSDIDNYINTGEPFDKAGAYAIQGKGRKLVESFSGSWHNIVGFPIEQFQAVIQKKGWSLNVNREKP